MIDILNSINSNEISINEAENLLEATIDKFHDNELEHTPQKELGLDKYEWTAIGFGIDLYVLAQWRKKGWPTSCENCCIEIDYKNFGWKIKDNKLICIKCNG